MFWFFFPKKKKNDLSTECKWSPTPSTSTRTSTRASTRASTRPRSWGLRADHLPGPGLVFRPWVEMCDLHLHRLHLQVLGRDPAHFVRDLIALDRDVLPLDAETERNEDEDEVRVKVGLAWNCLVVVARWVTVYNSYSFRVFLFRMWFLLMVYNSFLFKLLPNCTTGKKSQQSNFPPFFVLLYFIR